jgi:hypothetical protein
MSSFVKNGQSEESMSISFRSQNKDSGDDTDQSAPQLNGVNGDLRSLWKTHVQNGSHNPENGFNFNNQSLNLPTMSKVRKEPLWLEKVNMTPEIVFRFQLPPGDLNEILKKDLHALKLIGQVRLEALALECV